MDTMLELIIGIIICVVLQICAKKTQDTGKLTACIVINIICLVINGITLLGSLPFLLLMDSVASIFFSLVLKGIFAIWHICLIVNASKRKKSIPSKENTCQVVYCRQCGAASPEGAVFCRECGKKLEQEENVL